MKNIILFFLISISSLTYSSEVVSSSIKWEKKPQIEISRALLGKRIKEFNVSVEFFTDDQGNIKAVNVIKSSGNKSVDRAARIAMFNAKMQPYYYNGKTIATKGIQPFSIENQFAEEGPFYECTWEVESSQYTAQQRYQNINDALNNLDFVYLEFPRLSKIYETNKPIEKEVGKYDVVISSKNGIIEKVTSPTSKDMYGILAIAAVEGKKIQAKNSKWEKTLKNYNDTIKLSTKCKHEPLD